jgi:hypothetical protein
MSVMGKGIFLYMTESAGDCIIPGEFSFVEKLFAQCDSVYCNRVSKTSNVILGNPSGTFS